MSSSPIVVVVLCGLPGAGKSTFARSFAGFAAGLPHRVSDFRILEFDVVEDRLRRADLASTATDHVAAATLPTPSSSAEVQPSPPPPSSAPAPAFAAKWREGRKESFARLEEWLVGSEPTGAGTKKGKSQPTSDESSPLSLIVLDDNMYYTSMRHEVLQICRAHGCGLVVVWVDTPLDESVSRNESRDASAVVPREVIVSMAERFEAPYPPQASCDRHCVHVNGAQVSIESVDTLEEAFERVLSEAVKSLDTFASEAQRREEIERERERCHADLLHATELALRKAVSNVIKTASKNEQKEAALLAQRLKVKHTTRARDALSSSPTSLSSSSVVVLHPTESRVSGESSIEMALPDATAAAFQAEWVTEWEKTRLNLAKEERDGPSGSGIIITTTAASSIIIPPPS